MKREKTNKTGVYYRTSSTRRHNGKDDRCFDISFKMPDGRKVWEKVGWASEGYNPAMAAEKRAKRIRESRDDEDLPKKKKAITFGKLAKKYLEWAGDNKKAYRDDVIRYELHLKPVIGDKRLKDVSPLLLEDIKMKLLKDHAPATVKHVLVLVRQMFNKATYWGMWNGENPVKRVKLPTKDNKRTRFLSPDEARRLLEECERRSRQLYEMCMMGLQTGMRAGEIFGLRWGDVDLTNGLLKIKDPKSGQNRHAYLTPQLQEILSGKDSHGPQELVYKDRNGGRIKDISDTFERTVKALGLNEGVDRLDRVVFHTLRHTFASWLVQNGESLVTVARLLGHADLSMVNRYAHLSPHQERQAAMGIARMFDNTGPKGLGTQEENVNVTAS